MSKYIMAVAALAGTAVLAGCGPSAGDKVKRGEYLVAVASCSDCHTPGALMGKPAMDKALAGSEIGFEIPGLGVAFPPNLTPDNDTGLGKWSTDEIVKVVRTGVRPDGRQLFPVMPYGSYSKLTDDDAYAIAAFLKSRAPISNKVPALSGPGQTPNGPYQTTVFPQAASAAPTEAPAAPTPTPQ